jgi:branched-chain amino acid transport system ATP-binding protein
MTAQRAAAEDWVLSASNVTVRFGGLVALNGVSVDVRPQTIAGLVGPNGAGKSTLFAVLSGLRRPQTGNVTLMHRDVTRSSPQSRAVAGLARTFQQPELFDGLTVREHVLLASRVRHERRRLWQDLVNGSAWRRVGVAEQRAADEILDGLDLTPLAATYVTGMSLGTSRLVEMARALASGPQVLLLDEPSSGLDHGESERFVEVLRSVPGRFGAAILLVEHDVDMVLDLSSEVFVLDFGQLIARGRPDEIRRDPAVKAAYLGVDPRTSLGGEA